MNDMNIIATTINPRTAYVVITDGVNPAQDFTTHTGSDITPAKLAVIANEIASGLFGFTAELNLRHGLDGYSLTSF
jgi:hypothetical protein